MKMITFSNVCELINGLSAITKDDARYDEAQRLLKLEVTGYNIEEIQKLLES